MADTTYATVDDDLRLFDGIPASGEATYLQLLLNAAAGMADAYCNTRFESVAVTEVHDGTGNRFLKLRHRPVLSVTSVTLDDSAISSDSYEIDYDSGRLVVPEYDEDSRNPRIWREPSAAKPGWPRGTQNISVVYNYGHAATPDDVRAAVCMIAAGLYQDGQRRGVSAESMGPRSLTYKAHQALPVAAMQLLDRYRQYYIGG